MKKFTFIVLLLSLFAVSCSDDDIEDDVIKLPPLGDNSSIVTDSRIRVVSATSSSTNPEYPITKSYDEDSETYYESSALNTGSLYFPITITYSFTGEMDLDYIKYTPKSNSTRGSITNFYIEVIREGSFAYTRIGEFTLDGAAETTIIELERVNKVKSVRFIINAAVDNIVTCSEMRFYNNAKPSFDPQTIFTDELCDALRPEVTPAAIDTIPVKFYRDLATTIIEGGYSEFEKEFRIKTVNPYINPLNQAKTHKISAYSILDNPTGIYVAPGEDLILFMGYPYGKRLRVLIQNLEYGYSTESYSIKNGTNLITSLKGGLVYIQYLTSDGAGNPVKIHFASGSVNGYYDTAKHAPEEWQTRLNAAQFKYFDLVGKMTHMSYPVESFKQYTPSGTDLAAVTDSIVFYQHQLMGLYKYNNPIKNRLFMHVHMEEDMYMYATTYRTAYHLGTMPEVANADLLKTTALWGPAHEIGHVNQTRPGFLWAGMTEVSNNLFSQYTQERFNLETRLSSENIGTEYPNRFEKAFNELLNKPDSTHLMCKDVFCKLVPFWQLHLYFENAGIRPDVYPDFFEALRKRDDNIAPLSDGELQLNFIKIMCDVTQTNLLNFFLRWGMLTELDEVIDDYGLKRVDISPGMISDLRKEVEAKNYPKLLHRIEYIQDRTVDLYKNNTALVQGEASIDGLTVTTNGWQGVVAYEVYVAKKLVAIHTTSTFTIPTLIECEVLAVPSFGSGLPVEF